LAIGICQIKLAEDVQKIHFVYANAKTPCYYFLNKDLQTIKRENNVIGGVYKHEKTFSQTNLLLDRKTTFYIFTDGYADQGNEEKQRIGSEKVKNLILQYSDYPLQDQKKYFEDYFNEHQGISEQRDDVTVFAFKV
jgi:serine phosphatase RsbU (regulator of sigma subunit)